MGPRAGQKVFSLQIVPARADEPRKGVARYAGFSLHAGIGVEADQPGFKIPIRFMRPLDSYTIGEPADPEDLRSIACGSE